MTLGLGSGNRIGDGLGRRMAITRARRGLGDTSECGPNPCTFLDNLIPLNAFMSDTCKSWITCLSPTGPAATSVNTGVFAGGAQAVSSEITQTATDAVTGFFSGINWMGVAIIAVGGYVLAQAFGGKR
jgi:hypothetical protein